MHLKTTLLKRAQRSHAGLRCGHDRIVCLHCGSGKCWNPFSSIVHEQVQLACGPHWLAVHSDRLELYCGHCGDFVSDDRFGPTCQNEFLRSSECGQSTKDTGRIGLAGRGLRGLVNMGNTCYMSCVLQALVHNSRLQTFFLFETQESQCQCCNTAFLTQQEHGICLAHELKNLFTVCLSHQNGRGRGPLVPHSMLYTTWKLIGPMAGYGQQDAHELLLFLLDGLSQCGLTDEVFRGTLCSDIACATCGATSSRKEIFLDLSLAVEDAPSSGLRLEDCLARFTAEETLSDFFRCDNCDSAVERKKQLSIDKLPNLLVIHLKRFDTVNFRKILQEVDFPVDRLLNLAPFLSMRRYADSTTKLPTFPYALSAVVNHEGSMEQGHYTTFVKVEGHWFHCDDHHVDLATEDMVKESLGYVLLYGRLRESTLDTGERPLYLRHVA